MENGIINRKTSLSIQQKLDIVQKLDSGAPINQLADEYCIHPTTVRRIRRNGLTLHRLGNQGAQTRKRKRMRRPQNEELENRLYTWFLEQKAMGSTITDLLLQEQAQEMARQFAGATGFKASMGWLAKFKNRHDIRLVHTFDKKGTADVEAADEFAISFTRRMDEEDIQFENVYNMDETGLTWKAIPTKTVVNDNEIRMEGKKMKKDRVSFGLCANATGTHKLTPLFIHRFRHPRALKNAMNHLPVVFKTQKRAGMDRALFKDWYENHFKPAVKKRQLENGVVGKVFLLLDNCAGRKLEPSEYQEDDHFEIVFLPSNTSSILQPMDQGIIAKTKRSFRYKMLRRILSYPGGIQEFHQRYNIKDCIQFLHEAWTDVNAASIVNAWRGIIRTIPPVSPSMEETDPLEPQLEDMIAAIIGEEPSQEKVSEFLSTCEEAEYKEEIVSEEEMEEVNEEDDEQQLQQEEQENTGGQHQPEVQGSNDRNEGGQENNDCKEGVRTEQREEKEEVETDLREDMQRKELEESFNILIKHAVQEPRFIQLTVANLQEHFLKKKNVTNE